ncbi:guanitoxin biosynthesis pre-guanitoxin forming N-methyltransferase GntF [Paracoccus niistensis]|uniref:Guanitoxin biosynthesis pre-guanitoxin forming N-methyltransferase GntF n=1 Tax=Paracoccus niistensis TaxID=632935 RepID=A0ABV6I581_9RHOB
MATGAATLASICLLDAVAAAMGALLVVSDVLTGASFAQASGLLVVSYLAWGMALRPALAANRDILEREGISTCLPSKLAHGFALRWGLGPAGRRLAASAGYVGTELAKEAPYYLGASGAALLTEAVTSRDALAFLAGANLGAAAYEYGLARLLRAWLGRRSPRTFASFETDWSPAAYLADYYRSVEADERRTIAFLVDAARRLPDARHILVFGVGPTLHHVFPLVPKAAAIDLCDVLPANLSEIERWIAMDPDAHDWRPFVREALACEGGKTDASAVARREASARSRIGGLRLADLRDPVPLPGSRRAYDVVVSAFCADSATDDLDTWALYMRRIAGLVRPGGVFLVAALSGSHGYRVGGRLFPSAGVTEVDMRRVLAPLSMRLDVETCLLPEQAGHGYEAIILAEARLNFAPLPTLTPPASARTCPPATGPALKGPPPMP